MYLNYPQALLLLPTLILAGVMFLVLTRWKVRSLQLFAQDTVLNSLLTSVSGFKQRFKVALLLFALAASVVALGRPYFGTLEDAPKPGQGDVVVAMDVSLSMAAQDMDVSRLDEAKAQTLRLIDALQGDRIGLVVFAGDATLRFPTTYDYGAAKVFVRSVNPDSAPTSGSALSSGTRTAVLAVRQSLSPFKAVFLLSDGEDHGSDVASAIAQAAKEGVPVYTVGFGTLDGGPIPMEDGEMKLNQSGVVVHTRLEDAPLKLLAEGTGGSYSLASFGGNELRRAYESARQAGIEPTPAAEQVPFNDLTSIFVILAFIFLSGEYLINERRSVKVPVLPALTLALPLTLMLALACGTTQEGAAFKLNEQGTSFYQQSFFLQALDSFRQAQVQRPDMPELSINVGTALYKIGEYERSAREHQRALTSESQELRGPANFNIGNAFYQLGQYEEAYEAYRRALLQDPSDLDAKINLELALLRIQEQQAQQQEQERQAQQEGDGQSDQNSDQQSQQQQASQQGGGSQRQAGNENAQPRPRELRQALKIAGEDVTLEDAFLILDALREKENELQRRYHQSTSNTERNRGVVKDW